MASELELLNSATNHSVRMMGAISNALDKNLQVRQQAINSEIGLEMQLRQAEEQRRMNDASLERYRFMDQMAAQKFEMEKELLPLRKQTEFLRMQSEKERLKSYQQTRARQDFDEMVQPHNDRFGMWWMNSQNPAAANEYLQIKAKYAADIANGKPFDSNQFALDTNNIIEKYPVDDKEKPLTKWSYEGQIMADRISPSLGKAYQIKNPVIERNANALAVQYITDPKVTDISTYGEMYSPEYFALAAASREVYQSNVRQIDGLRDQWNDVAEGIFKAQQLGNDDSLNALMEQRKKIEDEISKREAQNSSISIKAATGTLDREDTIDPVMKEKERELPDPDQFKSGEPGASTSKDPFKYRLAGNEFINKHQSLNAVVAAAFPLVDKKQKDGPRIDQSLLDKLDLSGLSGQKIDKLSEDQKTYIKDTVFENMWEDDKKADEYFNREKITSLLNSLNKPANIKISRFVFKSLFEKGSRSFGLNSADDMLNREYESAIRSRATITFGKQNSVLEKMSNTGHTKISSADDFYNLIQNVKPNKREDAKKELYSALLAASIENALSK